MANIRDIVGMGIDDTNNLVFSWYADSPLGDDVPSPGS
jgi:hypothetical protein